jgi:hypothetical protein
MIIPPEATREGIERAFHKKTIELFKVAKKSISSIRNRNVRGRLIRVMTDMSTLIQQLKSMEKTNADSSRENT